MKDSDFIDMLHPVLDEADYVVYGVRVEPASRGLWGRLAVRALAGLPDSLSSGGLWFLIAFHSHGVIVQTNLGNRAITETLPVPDWDPSWKEGFRCVVIGNRRFTKLSREKLS